MLFSSITFLYYFLPIVMVLYIAVPHCMKNGLLLLASLVFYAWGEPKYVLLMIASIMIGYGSGRLIGAFRALSGKKLVLILAVSEELLLLGYFKYAGFLTENLAALTGLELPVPAAALPVGISFYTFQIISYLVDVYRGDAAVQKNVIRLATYVAMFPQLIAGPIVRYTDIEAALTDRTQNLDDLASGARRFIYGLAKKVLLANVLGELCSVFRASDEKSVLFYWLYAAAFALHIYFDFSGYSDMAIGLGRSFGFTFPENFDMPYASKSITEFWRRWHKTLGAWFRDYVYIPMGGNRVSRRRWFFNIFIVWMLTGLWHGAAWNFVVWGLLFAACLIIEKLWLLEKLEKARIWNHVYVLLVVLVTFVIFNASDMRQAAADLGGMLGLGKVPLCTEATVYYLKSYGVTLVISACAATPLIGRAVDRLRQKRPVQRVLTGLEPVALAALLLLSTAYLVDGSFNPFLYFRF